MAQARRTAALPGLLAAVRWRRRRRRLLRAAAGLLLAAAAVGVAWPRPPVDPGQPVAPSPAWRVVATDPTVLARCSAVTVVRPEWWIDDDGLQRLLREDDRPDGLVRTGGRVLVNRAAVDPFPVLQP
ncbi:MAG: hypothetical protein JNL08_12355 [Planctomycetes bacterium]|nr:hypothetical protein [Planctomycetota bacterium]